MSANLDDATALHIARQMPRQLRQEARRWNPDEPEILITHRAADVIEALLRMVPGTAPEAKQMVLFSDGDPECWSHPKMSLDIIRLTLSNVTPADLDAMKPGEVIEGTFKIEGIVK